MQKILMEANEYFGFETITVADTAIGFTASEVTPTTGDAVGKVAQVAECRLALGQIRFRMDGTNPTAAIGTLLEIGETLTIRGENNIRNFRGFRTGTTSGSLSCHLGF